MSFVTSQRDSLPWPVLEVPDRKIIRSLAIARYMNAARYTEAVCFSCGNAAEALRQQIGREQVLEIGPGGNAAMLPMRWFAQADIDKVFPGMFDATSGHLPMDVMNNVAEILLGALGPDPEGHGGEFCVDCGSGETFVALKLAFPHLPLHAVYTQSNPALQWNRQAPLNDLVKALAVSVIIHP